MTYVLFAPMTSEQQLAVPAAWLLVPWLKDSMVVLFSLLVPTCVKLKLLNGKDPAIIDVDPVMM